MKRVLTIIPTIAMLFSCGGSASSSQEAYSGPIEFIDPPTTVSIHTDLQASYLDDEIESVTKYATGKAELSRPKPVHLEWKSEDTGVPYFVLVSESPSLAGADAFKADGNAVDIYNLKVDTQYYYAVSEDGKTPCSKIESFATDWIGPRNIYISGVTNCRDIGGKVTKSGAIIKQGNIYRTGNVDAITEQGIAEMHRLGMVSEVDLRNDCNFNVSPVGEDINFHNYKMYYDDYSNYIERNCDAVVKSLRVFAHEENYPIFYHCRIGTDRTGYMTYLLLGLLGAEEEDIYRDYLFSNFGNIEDARTLHGSGVNNVQLYYDAIDAFPGETLQERVYNFLIAMGMTEEELDFIIDYNLVANREEPVLFDHRPIVANADEFELSDGLTLENYNGLPFVNMDKKKNEFVSAIVDVLHPGQYDVYVYLYSKNLSIYADQAFAITCDELKPEVVHETFSSLHCRATEGIYVSAKLASLEFREGDVEIVIRNITSSSNSSAYGANIARITLIPRLG